MDNNPLFSILIANYNNGKYFIDCYNSILSQSYQNWEAIIVDDCSTDDSVEQIKNIIGEDNRFKLYTNEENKGCGYTKRRCAELATGEICGFVDPDDAITPEAIEIMVKTHSENLSVGLIYSNIIICDEKLNIQTNIKREQVKNKDFYYFNLPTQIHHFTTFKSKDYKNTTGIGEYIKRAVDQDLYLKLYEVSDVKYIDYPLYLYRVHQKGISTFANEDNAYFWHWFVIFEAAKRRNINIENLFWKYFKRKDNDKSQEKLEALEKKINLLKNSRILKFLYKIGIFQNYKYL